MNKFRYIVGIDPGSVKTGIAVWDSVEKTISTLMEFDAHCQAQEFLQRRFDEMRRENVFMRIEDARLSKLPKHLQKSGRDQGAGYVKALSKDWEEFAKMECVQYECVSPQSQRYKKATPEFFASITGIKTNKTQDHMRDAALMVYDYRK